MDTKCKQNCETCAFESKWCKDKDNERLYYMTDTIVIRRSDYDKLDPMKRPEDLSKRYIALPLLFPVKQNKEPVPVIVGEFVRL